MERMNVIKVVVTPQQPIEVKTQVKTTQVQIGTDAALGAVTQGVIDLHAKVDDLANKQVEVDLSPIAKEDTLTQGLSSVESKVEEVGNKIDNIKLPEIDTSELASKDLERFFGLPSAIPEYEPMTEEELIAQAEDIWNTIFNE